MPRLALKGNHLNGAGLANKDWGQMLGEIE